MEEKNGGATVLTIGYSGLSAEDLREYAEQKNAIIVDTRLKPLSRIPDWRKSTMIARFYDNGFSRYTHIDELGNLNYKGGPIEIKDLEAGLPKVKALLDAGFVVILLCVCRDVERCHRSVVAAALAERYGVSVRHLEAEDVEQGASGRGPMRLI